MYMEKFIYLHGMSTEEFQHLLKNSVKEILDSKKEIIHQSNAPEKLLSRKEVSEYLGITLTTLHKWMNKGLPFETMNGRRYFLLSEVLADIKTKKLQIK